MSPEMFVAAILVCFVALVAFALGVVWLDTPSSNTTIQCQGGCRHYYEATRIYWHHTMPMCSRCYAQAELKDRAHTHKDA